MARSVNSMASALHANAPGRRAALTNGATPSCEHVCDREPVGLSAFACFLSVTFVVVAAVVAVLLNETRLPANVLTTQVVATES